MTQVFSTLNTNPVASIVALAIIGIVTIATTYINKTTPQTRR